MRTAFQAEKNGFAFVNSWRFDETERKQLRNTLSNSINGAMSGLGDRLPTFLAAPAINQVQSWLDSAMPDAYGLCGGMAFAAKDYYLAKKPLPQIGTAGTPDQQTPQGQALRDYLWRRQLDSLIPNAPTLIMWMVMLHLPDLIAGADWLLAQTRQEWVKLKGFLNKGEPWPLCLIGTSRSPFDNHQVLAIGFEAQDELTGTIFVYDMNCPGHEQTIQLDLRGNVVAAKESCANPSRGPLRGFFCEAYSPVTPPDLGTPPPAKPNVSSTKK